MFNNIGHLDRIIRFSVAGILMLLGLNVYQGTTLGTALVIISFVPNVTAIFGSCPLYGLLGINTKQSKAESQ